jgi:glycosyltransferase involved in cell wall biosynthesis
MGRSHYFDDFLAVARELRHEQDIAFALVGNGSRRAEIERFVAEHALRNVHLNPFQPPHLLGQSLAVGDVHFVALRERCTGLAVPSKSYGILAAGRPIVYQGSPQSEIGRMVTEEDVGTVVPCGNVPALRTAILRYRDAELRSRQGRNARSLSEGKYGREGCLRAYAALLRGATGHPSSRSRR